MTTEQPAIRYRAAISLLLPLFFAVPLRVAGSTVNVPIQLDFPLLRQVLLRQLFETPDQSAELLHDPLGCSRIVVAEPQLRAKQLDLEVLTEVSAVLGMSTPGGCTTLLQWQGSAGFLGRPLIQSGLTAVRIEPRDSWLLAPDGSKLTSGRLWDLARDRLQGFFSRFTLELAPSVDVLGTVLPDVLARRSAQQLQTIVDSLALSDVQVYRSGLNVSLSFEVEELAIRSQPEPPLSSAELQQWETHWQAMDALLTFAVKYYASATSLQELRSTLLDLLLDSRYRLRDVLTGPASHSNDALRRWFVDSWQRLSPPIRRIGLEQTGQDPLLWTSLLTATDALSALDRLGPAIGMDISAAGLRRLARLINDKSDVDPLRYDQAVDPELQQLFRLPRVPAPEKDSAFRLDLRPIRFARAGSSIDRLDRWAPNQDQLGEYLPLVASLLQETAKSAPGNNGLEPPLATLFRRLVLATAWQESCWRQYVTNKGKMEPLRSSTGDVGLMQINEMVWRGFYDIQKLRWEIAYNSRAGAEILLKYLVSHALKQGEHKRAGGLDNLARASYSAYNGGPSQVSRYRRANAASSDKAVDTAFWKKYQQVSAGNELNVAQCLGGETSYASTAPPAAMAVKETVSGNKKQPTAAASRAVPDDAGERWVLAQSKDRFTLQLAVFSTREAARKFVAQLSLAGRVAIYPVRKARSTQFAVLYGSYATRSDADRAKQKLEYLKPWRRQFGEVRSAGRS